MGWRQGRAVLAVVVACFLAGTAPLQAECQGENLFDTLPAAELADLRARADSVPYPRGNIWHATRDSGGSDGPEVIWLIGTYHFPDPRHDTTLTIAATMMDSARTVLVEAAPAEQAELKRQLASDPGLMLDLTGPTLPEALPKAEWQQVADALRARGIPPFAGAKFRPWYLSVLLGISPCAMTELEIGGGLDDMIVALAEDRGLPVRSLEPYNRVFSAFEDLPRADQLSMITAALALEPQADDLAVTLADTYFAQESRLIWELQRSETLKVPGYTPERVDRELATIGAALMTGRNRDWIPVILAAAAEGPVLAAFGALHLSGDAGVLALLEAEGFTLTERTP